MPAHVYIRTGDYEAAVKTNEEAAAVDRAYIKSEWRTRHLPDDVLQPQFAFHRHVRRHEWKLRRVEEECGSACRSRRPHVKEMPPLEGFMTIPIAVDVRFHRWNDILKMPQPSPDMKIIAIFWHFARGMALAGTGKTSEAEAEYKIVADAEQSTPEDVVFAMPVNNKAKDIMRIAKDVLGAKIASTKKDYPGAITMLTEAVVVEDSLKYGEPPDWFFPVRESLGAAFLVNGDAAGAEKVFRADLERNPRNPRSLFGLQQALKAESRDYDAGFIEHEFDSSWKGEALKVEDLV